VNRGRGCGRGPYIVRPPYCMYRDNEIDHRTKVCPILIEVKKENGSRLSKSFVATCTQASQPQHAMEPSTLAILTILSFPLFTTTSLPNQSAPPPAYYQSYHYATTNHPRRLAALQITYPPPPSQITYSPPVSQITYPVKKITPKSKRKLIHHHHHKPKNPSNKMKPSHLTARSLQSLEVPE
jgi:hypothetical protein